MTGVIPFISVAVIIGAMSAKANAEIHPFRASYEIYYNNVKFGDSERIYKKISTAGYKLTSKVSVLLGSGSYRNNTWFNFDADTVKSHRYEHESRVVGFRTISSGDFYRDGSVVMNYDDKKKTMTVSPYVIDIGALTIQLQHDVKRGKNEFSYEWIFEGELDQVTMQRAGEEVISTVFGKMKAVKLKQITKKSKVVYLWFLPELDYQLSRIEIYKKGKKWGQLELTALSFR